MMTIREACAEIKRKIPTTEAELDRLAYDLLAYGIKTNCDHEPFWKAAREREYWRRWSIVQAAMEGNV